MINKLISTITYCGLLLLLLSSPAKAQSGNQIYAGLDVLAGEENTSPRLRVITRYKITPQLSAGLGTGFTYYHDPLSLVPVFANLTYHLTTTGLAPFLFLNTGYNVSILTDTDTRVDSHSGGWMLNPGIGLRFNPESGPGWELNVGYSLDHSEFKTQEGPDRTARTDLTYKRLTAGFGLMF